MPRIDRLVQRLFQLGSLNPEYFSALRSERAAPFFSYLNDWPLVPPLAQKPSDN
jgi:hypothetical protein